MDSPRLRLSLLLSLALLAQPAAAGNAPTSSTQDLQVEVLTDRLDAPWGLAFLPDGRMLVTERAGAMLLLNARGERLATIKNVPESFVKLQGGLLDVALHPQFASNSRVYLSLAHGRQKRNTTRVVRAVLRDDVLTDVEVIFDSTVKGTSAHYGGRLAFLRDGTLLVTTGDGVDYREDAQRLESTLGKVIRINDDGSAPRDNPFTGRDRAQHAIWSYGHRNPQGLYVDPETDAVYLAEHGPQGGDEINLIEKGVNYGWPIATHGIDYTNGRISPFETYAGMREPLVYWTPSIGPGGVALYRGALFPEWEGDLLVAVLGHTQLRRIDLDDGRVIAQQPLLEDRRARFRQVVIGPEGAIYALIDAVADADQSGQLLKITPGNQPSQTPAARSSLLTEAADRSPRNK
jgi:glucose/arabinose dehydrogenase